MKLKFKKLMQQAVAPSRANENDAGFDLTATSRKTINASTIEYGTGLALEIPTGYVGLIFPRSSICKKAQMLSNSVGVIDSGYRGEVKFIFKHNQDDVFARDSLYQEGDRVGQLVLVKLPKFELEEVEELSSSERGEGGFGSSGE